MNLENFSMLNKNIERNKLDYILTDLLPLELSELYSLNNFYDYLMENFKELDLVQNDLMQFKGANKSRMFEGDWDTAPLKYKVLKGIDSERELNVIQPLSVMNVYFFMECYQKELLILLKENACYSIRYHKKNNSLFYKKRVKRITEYFEDTAKKISKAILQQTGAYFKISKFDSVSSFTSSKLWQQCNFKYRYFARIDYKSCFDSIYTHSYKWIIEKNVIDSKRVKNTALFITIDRLLQNINSKSSNGLLVGPEFSRLMAELLLQHIDYNVKISLEENSLEQNEDYSIYRYVDDIFIFSNTPDNIDRIIETYKNKASQFLLKFNELKIMQCTTPFILNTWLSKTRKLADEIASLFHRKVEINNSAEINYLLKEGHVPLDRIKDNFNALICDYPESKRYIVSFILSTLLNQISNKKDGINIFSDKSKNKAFALLELIFYIYSFCTCFEHTQKIISMFVYINDEIDFMNNKKNNNKLQLLCNQYSFIFESGNLNDLCNLFLLYYEYNIIIPTKIEDKVIQKLTELNNPILWANYLIYSQYYNPYHKEVLSKLEDIIDYELDKIFGSNTMLHQEFWYVIIFNNCPFLNNGLKTRMEDMLKNIISASADSPVKKITNLICNYMLKRSLNQFYCWGYYRFSPSKQVAFRTYQRSLFKHYKKKSSVELYGSID